MWVEINPVNMDPEKLKVWDISKKPPEELEVRVCILNCKDVVMMDFEGTCDTYIRGFFDTKEDVQETDTHFRNMDGKPDFQYRLVYRIKVPRKGYKYTVQGYDRDFFSANEMLGEAQVDLQQMIEDTLLVKRQMTLSK